MAKLLHICFLLYILAGLQWVCMAKENNACNPKSVRSQDNESSLMLSSSNPYEEIWVKLGTEFQTMEISLNVSNKWSSVPSKAVEGRLVLTKEILLQEGE